MFVSVQVRIFHKMTKNKQKPSNNEHKSRICQKVKLGIKVELKKSSEFVDAQEWPLIWKFEKVQDWSSYFSELTYSVPHGNLWRKVNSNFKYPKLEIKTLGDQFWQKRSLKFYKLHNWSLITLQVLINKKAWSKFKIHQAQI